MRGLFALWGEARESVLGASERDRREGAFGRASAGGCGAC